MSSIRTPRRHGSPLLLSANRQNQERTGSDILDNQLPKQILSVTDLTQKIKLLLEETFPIVWICGEISNLRIPGSGHAYFTLKDDKSQISAVMFRGQLRHLKFKLEDGTTIVGLGRISLYEPRGTYQIILEYAEPKGAGALQVAFEQLKRKLSQEGLFDAEHKSTLPFLPHTICVVTSPAGAAIRDILNIIQRRFPGINVEILPVNVQGDRAAEEIVHAIGLANRRGRADVIILARGGGSIEDLAAFNSELVARAIFGSIIPIVSAIGHETDFTIADFVADMRAPTPSAAAELTVPVKADLKARCADLYRRCADNCLRIVSRFRDELSHLRRSLVHPVKKIQELQLRLDDLTERLHRSTVIFVRQRRARSNEAYNKILLYNPIYYVDKYRSTVDMGVVKLTQSFSKRIYSNRSRLNTLHATLIALSPQAVLLRGYSITRLLPEQTIVTRADSVIKGQSLEILLAHGKLDATVD